MERRCVFSEVETEFFLVWSLAVGVRGWLMNISIGSAGTSIDGAHMAVQYGTHTTFSAL
jgi:hypothetical protein